MPFVRAATLSELVPDEGKLVTLAGRPIALFLSGGAVYALDEACPHRGAPMHEGWCEGGTVTCPWHNAAFELATGKNLNPPAKSPLRSYPTRVSDAGDVEVEIP